MQYRDEIIFGIFVLFGIVCAVFGNDTVSAAGALGSLIAAGKTGSAIIVKKR